MLLVFDLNYLIVFGHRQRIIYYLILGLPIGINFNKLFTSKILIFSFCANRSFDLPRFGSWIFNNYLLRCLFPDHAIKLQLLNSLLWLWNTFTYQIDIQMIHSFYHTFHLKSYIIIRDIWVESHIEM